MKPKINYLQNATLVELIRESKASFSEYDRPNYIHFDLFCNSLQELTPEFVQNGLVQLQSGRPTASAQAYLGAYNRASYYQELTAHDLVIRVNTFDHIPDHPDGSRTGTKAAKLGKMEVNFPPFQHWMMTKDGFRPVGYSHWHKGSFNTSHGRILPELGQAYVMLVERIGQKSNFAKYSYLEDMKGAALLNLTAVGLKFNETTQKTQLNPFAYLTACVYNTFKRCLNAERTTRRTRDQLLEERGFQTSWDRQLRGEGF
jgi:hypothetical protein